MFLFGQENQLAADEARKKAEQRLAKETVSQALFYPSFDKIPKSRWRSYPTFKCVS
jgi:hypothetical protein